ncbi:hypothetical protein HGRIS_013340 [Hohenbuehelia grisea]|uniref:beta-glucosidase n=1 Tax=Hohenbuehelia grisea TaxID=104357 RepID=A0ABR3IVC4_9AGAR
MSRAFLDAYVPELVKKLTIDEKISLLGAPNWWNTTPIPRLDIPSIRMSDGPNGVRGSSHFVSTPAQCLPCGASLASTFDPDLVRQAGVFLGEEAKLKSSVVLLAPTCNMQRSPLGGRSFECFSEDPHLSGTMAAAYVNGLQSQGVSATIKHLVGNDQEHERTAAESVLSDRALREIYLYPFMIAQRDAQPGAYMTSYGRLRGAHCSENAWLLQKVLRDEWKFKGIVISDWFGTYGVNEPLNAGLDLEMPGPPRWRTNLLVHHCLGAQKLFVSTIDERITTLLTFIQQQARKNPDVVYGDGIERSRDSPGIRQFCRELAAEGIVLLRNRDNLLPLSSANKQILLVGPHLHERVISGGGSAALKPTYVITPWDGITQGAPEGVEVLYSVGCYAHKYLPTLENWLQTKDGQPGWLCTFYRHDAEGEPADIAGEYVIRDTRIKLNDFLPPNLTPTWTIRLTGRLTVESTGPFELGLTVAGRAKLWVNGVMTIDNWTKQIPGEFFYGQGSTEEKAVVELVAGEAVDILVEYINTPPPDDGSEEAIEKRNAQPALMRGVRLGGCPKIDPNEAIENAVALARTVDTVIYVGGLTPEWESEGFDRPSLQLPGRQDEVIAKLAAANPNTVVCLQAGSPVSMPWIDSIGALVQTWYSGNEVGNALADIIFGKVNPSGRLPITYPVRIEDVPSYLNLRSENGKIHYREDLFMGYRHYIARRIKPLFPFGFGLSYTRFSLSNLTLSSLSEPWNAFTRFEVLVEVKNEGNVVGSEVIQVYVTCPTGGFTTPRRQLKGFAKARDVVAGQKRTVRIALDKYAFSIWNSERGHWNALAGEYVVEVGTSCEDIALKGSLKLEEGFVWTGL